MAGEMGMAFGERCKIGKPCAPRMRYANGAIRRPSGLEEHSGTLPEGPKPEPVIHVNQGALLCRRLAVAAVIGSHEMNTCLVESSHRVRCLPTPGHIPQ